MPIVYDPEDVVYLAAGATIRAKPAYISNDDIEAGMPIREQSTNVYIRSKCIPGHQGVTGSIKQGIAVNSAAPGQPVAFLTKGKIGFGVSLIAGMPYFVGYVYGTIISLQELLDGDDLEGAGGVFPVFLGFAVTEGPSYYIDVVQIIVSEEQTIP